MILISRIAAAPVHSSLCIALCDVAALIIELFALRYGELQLHLTVLQVQLGRDEAIAIGLRERAELTNLALVKKKLSFAKRIAIEDIALFIRADMHADDENFSVLDLGIGVLNIDFSHTNTLHLGPYKSDTALISIFDEVFMPCLSIFTEELDSRLYRHSAMERNIYSFG